VSGPTDASLQGKKTTLVKPLRGHALGVAFDCEPCESFMQGEGWRENSRTQSEPREKEVKPQKERFGGWEKWEEGCSRRWRGGPSTVESLKPRGGSIKIEFLWRANRRLFCYGEGESGLRGEMAINGVTELWESRWCRGSGVYDILTIEKASIMPNSGSILSYGASPNR